MILTKSPFSVYANERPAEGGSAILGKIQPRP